MQPPAKIRRRALRVLAWVLTLALHAAVLPVCAYFAVNSTAGQDGVRSLIDSRVREGAIDFERVQWGPNPGAVVLHQARVLDRNDEPAITADWMKVQLDLPALMAGSFYLTEARAHGYVLSLAWDAEGTFNLKDAFKKKKKKKKKPKPKPKVPPILLVGGIDLIDGVVELRWPKWGLVFEHVSANGTVGAGEDVGLVIDADLTGGRSRAIWGPAADPTELTFSQIGIAAFKWRGQGFETSELRLQGPGEALVSLEGGMVFAEEQADIVAVGLARLNGPQLTTFLGPRLPDGASIALLDLASSGQELAGTLGAVQAPTVVLPGGVRLEGVAVDRITGAAAPGSLVPDAQVQIDGLAVRHAIASGPEASWASGVTVPSLSGRSGGAIEVMMPHVAIEHMGALGAVAGPATGSLQVAGGLTGGKVTALLRTPEGLLRAAGDIGIDLFSASPKLTLRADATGLSGSVADSLLAQLPPKVGAALQPPLAADAVLTGKFVKVERAGGRTAKVPRLIIDSLRMRGVRTATTSDGKDWTLLPEAPR